MVKGISILGSTGSIGRQTLDVCRRNGIKVLALSANSNTDLLYEQALEFEPELVLVYDKDAKKNLADRLYGKKTAIVSGMSGLIEAATLENADCVVTAVSGAVGLKPTLAAIRAKKRIALANKETLVCAGQIIMEEIKKSGAELLPIDSEHSAVFQCVEGRRNELSKIILTASGGPFFGKTQAETETVTVAEAVKHPSWSMGAKISVDSATMMNKGLEVIEAMHLFSCEADDIEVIIHPESVVHSMVQLKDGSVIAQLGAADMRIPIQYALTYPQRAAKPYGCLDLKKIAGLHFFEPDLINFPCLRIAVESAKKGGTAPAVLSAANEAAVSLFLNKQIGFNRIYACVAEALSKIDIIEDPSLEEILEADLSARAFVKENHS